MLLLTIFITDVWLKEGLWQYQQSETISICVLCLFEIAKIHFKCICMLSSVIKFLYRPGPRQCTVHVCSAVSDFLWSHGLQPTRFLCPWNFPGKNTGVGCIFPLQGIFLTQGSNRHLLCLLLWLADSLPPRHLWSINIISNTYNNQEGTYCPPDIFQMEKVSHVDWMT